MNGKHRKIRKLHIFFIILIAVVGILLTVSLCLYFSRPEAGDLPLVRSETMYLVIALALLLPFLLFIFFLSILFSRKNKGQEQTVVPVRQVSSERAAEGSGGAEGEKNGKGIRFEGLTAIDAERGKYVRENYEERITLKGLCERFRNYAAGRLGLYYSESDIRRFIAGLLVSHIMILQGMSGTGKTSLAYAFGEFVDNPSLLVPVQPMWKERTDLVGYYNEFTQRFNETDLLKAMYKANYSKDIYITVLDEMNIARVEYYFAEFLSLLELPNAEERKLNVVSGEWENDPEQLEEGHILLPENMWFIGTANNDDSTFAISDKVYDRAMIMDLDTKAEIFEAEGGNRIHLTAKRFQELGEEARKEYEMTRRNLSRLEALDEYMKEKFRVTFGNRIMKQIRTYVPVYIACGGEELEALDDILAKKVMRKLGMKNPVYIRNQADRFCGYLDELFGEDAMKACKAVVQRLKLNA